MPAKTPAKIKKRDGRIVPFYPQKISTVILKAGQATGEFEQKEAERLSDLVVKEIVRQGFDGNLITVEQVQDIVEEVLMGEGHFKTAKAYIIYREQHTRLRELQGIDSDKLMTEYLEELDWRVKENANMTYSLQGLNNHVASAVSSHYWLNKIYPPEIRKAHLNCDLHLHNLQLLAPYCCGWDLKDLLVRGFGGVPGKIESRPPKYFRTALGQLVNFLYTLQGEIAGAVAVDNFDTYLAPFIHYDGLNYEQVRQAMQEFMFWMNVPTRVGFQTPFSNCTLDITPPGEVGEEAVIIGGKQRAEKYSDFQKEMDWFNRAFGEIMLEGDAKGRVFTFPIPTYNITKSFDWENENLGPVWEMTAKYGIPYFANFINSDMKPEDIRSMCPVAGSEKVLTKSTRGRQLEYSLIKSIYEGSSKKSDYEVFSDGGFVRGKFNKFTGQKMIKITLENNHELRETTEHLNYVMRTDRSKVEVLKGKELGSGMYLPYSLKIYQGEGGDEELGYFVGAFAGDGSYDGETAVIFSLEVEQKKEVSGRLEKISKEFFGAHCVTKTHQGTRLLTLKVQSQAAVGLCKDFVAGKGQDKHYQARLFNTSIEFRRGVLAGHYATDGGNRNRIYTSSKKMVETLNMLAATLGTTTSIYKDERDGRLGSEPNYAVLVYQLNRKNYGDFWFKAHKKLWVRIKSIEPIPNTVAYCFEVEGGKPVFTVGTTGILTHNCRLRLDTSLLQKRGGSLFGSNPLTGSIGVVTINLPRIGKSVKSEKEFFEGLEHLMDLAKDSLEIKRKAMERFTEGGLYPYARHYLDMVKERFGNYWANHFSTIGLCGMNEALLNFMDEDIASEKGRRFALEVLDFMREKLLSYQEETGHLYNLEATPAEGTTHTFAKADEYEKSYYTNSTNLPVGYTDDLFRALGLQDELQCKYTGGTVFHAFLGERLGSGQAVKNLVRKVFENYRLPYFTLTPTFSICAEHGYLAGEQKKCPSCGRECEVYSRVVGYLRPVNQWNVGKQAEFAERKEFSNPKGS